MASNAVVCGPILPKFELIQDIMHVFDICKFKNDQINSNQEKVEKSILDVQWQLSGLTEIQTDPSFNALTHVLGTCKNEEDPIKMKALEWP